MASTYSPKLKFELIGAGEQAGLWGTTTNKNIGELIEQAIAGVTTVDLTGISGNYTLSSLDGTVDQARSAVISCTGTAAAAVSIIIPTSTKLYVFRNASGYPITIKTAGQIGGVVLNNGEANSIFCDGANALAGLVTTGSGYIPVSGGGTGVTSFTPGFVVSPTPGGYTALTTVPYIALSSDVSGQLGVLNGGTGRSSLTQYNVLLGAGTSAVDFVAPGANGNVLTSNGTTWVSSPNAASGVTSLNNGGNITLSASTGPITISLTSTNVINALGYTPVSSSSLSSYASLTTSSQQTFTGSLRCPAGVDTGASGMGLFGKAINFDTYSSIFYSANQMQFAVSTSGFNLIMLLDTNGVYMGKSIYPNTDNAYALGWAGGRWTVVYAVNGAIQTSDRNDKTEIADLDAAEKRVATRLKGLIKKFKFKDAVAEKGSDGARIHVGVIAQDVGDAFRAEGLDPNKYGVFCYDEWEAKNEVLGKNGEVAVPATPAGSRYGVRYDELFAFIISAL